MNLIEALDALKEGKRVRNKIWEKDEYIMLKNGFIKYGNGVTHRIDVCGEHDMCDDMWEECKESILTDKEKEHLGAVIKPFRDRVVSIRKEKGYSPVQFISIKLKRYDYAEEAVYEYVDLPYFIKDTMYVNMELNRYYALEELGL